MDDCMFTWIGIVISLYFSLNFAAKVIHACRVYFFPTYPDFFKYGKWSVVTGSTDGIGKAIALNLASRGQNIVLIARNKEKLEKVSTEIETRHNVQTKHLQIDFSHDEDIYDKIEEFLKGMDIGTLVNNVGIAAFPTDFLDTPKLSETIRNITRVNMTSVFKMHQLVLPGMVQRKRGLIINVSAAAAIRPTIYFTVYGSTKAFVDYFSQALSYEYADKGITILSALPFGVSTNIIGNPSHNIFTLSSDDYAASLLATVEKERSTCGCWPHALQGWLSRLLPVPMHCYVFKKLIPLLREKMKRE